MFSIYSSALLCMQVDEVQKYFKESKTTLLARYRQCAQQALVNAGVLGTSELMVLQAFVLFIVRIEINFFGNDLILSTAFSPTCIQSTYSVVFNWNLHSDSTAHRSSQRRLEARFIRF